MTVVRKAAIQTHRSLNDARGVDGKCELQHRGNELNRHVGLECVAEPLEESRRLQERARGQDLLAEREQNLLLPLIASKGAVLMPRARVAQRLVTVEEVDAGLDVEGLEAGVGGVRKAFVVDRLGHVDLDAAKEVNELPKAVEVKHDQVVHIDAHDFADAPPEHVGSFILVDGVDAIGFRAAIGDAQVARDRDQGRGIVCRLDSGEHHGIRAPRGLARSLVQSQQEQGERPVAGPVRGIMVKSDRGSPPG